MEGRGCQNPSLPCAYKRRQEGQGGVGLSWVGGWGVRGGPWEVARWFPSGGGGMVRGLGMGLEGGDFLQDALWAVMPFRV